MCAVVWVSLKADPEQVPGYRNDVMWCDSEMWFFKHKWGNEDSQWGRRIKNNRGQVNKWFNATDNGGSTSKKKVYIMSWKCSIEERGSWSMYPQKFLGVLNLQ